jgi:hypothetical protein
VLFVDLLDPLVTIGDPAKYIEINRTLRVSWRAAAFDTLTREERIRWFRDYSRSRSAGRNH